MPTEPDKFYVGMIDFFSIILPGFVLAFYLNILISNGKIPVPFVASLSEPERWVVLIVGSYILGHFIFLIGSFLDRAYDAVREKIVPFEKNLPLKTALDIKNKRLTELGLNNSAINAFQWAKCRLALEYPGALNHVQRLEADSKFFRSLLVILVILCVIFAQANQGWWALVCLLLAIASVWRY